MVRLVTIDVDGTLVGSSGVVSPKVWAAAERARALGVRLAIASGRPAFGTTREHAHRLDPSTWHVFQNGASVVDVGRGATKSTPMPKAVVRELVERRIRHGRCLELYTDGSWASEGDEGLARAHAGLLGVSYEPRTLNALEGDVVRAQWLVDDETLAVVLAEPHEGLEMVSSTSPVMPGIRFVNLTARGVSKASAIRAIAEDYAISLDDVMHVGDSGNDREALETVGWPVAMANAEPEIHAVAKHRVGHVDDGGASEAIELAIRSRG